MGTLVVGHTEAAQPPAVVRRENLKVPTVRRDQRPTMGTQTQIGALEGNRRPQGFQSFRVEKVELVFAGDNQRGVNQVESEIARVTARLEARRFLPARSDPPASQGAVLTTRVQHGPIGMEGNVADLGRVSLPGDSPGRWLAEVPAVHLAATGAGDEPATVRAERQGADAVLDFSNKLEAPRRRQRQTSLPLAGVRVDEQHGAGEKAVGLALTHGEKSAVGREGNGFGREAGSNAANG